MLSVWILAPNTTSAQCASDSLEFCATYNTAMVWRGLQLHMSLAKQAGMALISWVSRDNKRIGSNEHAFHSRQFKEGKKNERKGIKSGAVQAGLVAGQGSNIKVRGKRQTKSRRCKTECPWVEHGGGPPFWKGVGTWHYLLFLRTASIPTKVEVPIPNNLSVWA